MTQNKSREAYFQLVLALHDPKTNGIQFFEEKCPGKLLFPARGGDGFGYDPIFAPEGYNRTFAELGLDKKRQLSARARALKSLLKEAFGVS